MPPGVPSTWRTPVCSKRAAGHDRDGIIGRNIPLATGTRFGPDGILAPLGAGGMGEVCKARDTRLDRTVAVKVLPSHIAAREDLKARFEREARAVSSLNHPHICTLYDIGKQDGVEFMVMEHLEGETLQSRLTRGPLPLDHALKFADSRSLAYFTEGKLRRIDIAGGAPHSIRDVAGGRGGAWGPDGTILFSAVSTGRVIHRVPSSGGTPAAFTKFDESAREGFHTGRRFSPTASIFFTGGIYLTQVAPTGSMTG